MDNFELLEAMHQEINGVRATVELLEIRVRFLDDYLEKSNPELWAQYQLFLFAESQRMSEDSRTALANIPGFRELFDKFFDSDR